MLPYQLRNDNKRKTLLLAVRVVLYFYSKEHLTAHPFLCFHWRDGSGAVVYGAIAHPKF